MGRLIRRYKYARTQRMDRALSTLLADLVQGRHWHDHLDALVPVPTAARSWLDYRFRPVELMAAGVGRRLGLPVLPLIGVRGKRRRQVELSATQRVQNVRGVYYLRRHARARGATLCILDDVSTSGATLYEIGRVLRRAGAARVYAATIAAGDASPSS
jgi:ComF family protein